MVPSLHALATETLRIGTHHESDDDLSDDRFAKSEIVLSFLPQPATHWASNVIQRLAPDQYVAYIFIDPAIAGVEMDLRKMIFAEEWLEVMIGIADPYSRLGKQTASRIALIELYATLGRDAHWIDNQDEKLEKRAGLQHLLLSEHTVRRFIEKRYQTTVENIRKMANQEGQANEVGALIRSIERSISADRFLKLELVQLRLAQVIFSGVATQ